MRSSTVVCFVILLAVAVAPAQERREGRSADPFEGWDEAKIEAHRAASLRLLNDLARDWIDAKKSLIRTCGRCKGAGQVPEYVLRQTPKMVKCPTCDGSGQIVSPENFFKVFWDHQSDRFRTDERRRKLESRLKMAQFNPKQAIEDLGVIDGCRRRKVEVLGNHASATFVVKKGGDWVEEYAIFIEERPGEWRIFEIAADRVFPLAMYPGEEDEDPSAAPEPHETGEWTDTEAEARRTERNPAELFNLAGLKIRLVEGRDHRVSGSIENKTRRSRFAYIVVRVSLFRDDERIEETTCSVEDAILEPGEFAAFTGHFYWDERPKYDRIEAVVIQFEALD